MNLYKGLLFQGGYFTTPDSLELLGAFEESIGIVVPQKHESRPAAASVVGRDGDCCPA